MPIRPARPDDVDVAIPLIYSSGPAAFDFVFGHGEGATARDFLRHAFLDGAGEYGWRNHWVAEEAGEVVGIGAAYDGSTTLPFLLAAVRQIIASHGWRAPAVMVRGLRVEQVIPPPQRKDELYLAHLGVAPAWRSRGVGAKLIAHLLNQAGPRHRLATLDVACTNPRAQALYARLGFTVTGERISRLRNAYATVAHHRRMALALPASALPG